MQHYHILNGDCLAEQLTQTMLNENHIVFRECLIEGPFLGDTLSDFWENRAKFFSERYKVKNAEFWAKTVSEFEKKSEIPAGSEVCLWFENDLFCQANLWFLISVLAERKDLKIFRVFPHIKKAADKWKGFGISTKEDLLLAFDSKIPFSDSDISLGKNLWEAYKNKDTGRLLRLSSSVWPCFEDLLEVCQAHLDRHFNQNKEGRPESKLRELIATHGAVFTKVFTEFSKTEGIYGFGDLQVKYMFDQILETAN
jgi:hypothetical protein